MNTKNIFVQIASYRDPDLKNTINDLLSKAKYPENINIGICWQHGDDEWDNLDIYKNHSNIKILDVDYTQSKGACWARHLVQKLYSGEYFSLQIDSHSRFEPNWDNILIKCFESLNDDMAILTAYPSMFNPEKPYEEYDKQIYVNHVYAIKNGQISARPKRYEKYADDPLPRKAVALAAGFIFGRGHLNKIKYDPEFYFTGEEAGLAVRYFTNGYNLYHPNKKILYHFYTRKNQKKHWSDHKNWPKLSGKANARLQCLLGRKDDNDLGEYTLGNIRSLEDWRLYSGIDYANSKLHSGVIAAAPPPYEDKPDLWVDEKDIK